MNRRLREHSAVAHGFSLVELLVVIAVLAIIAALAIPGISGTMSSSEEARDMRNAQMLSSVSQAAVAAGHAGAASVDGWISLLTNGVVVTNVYGEAMASFRIDSMTEAEVLGASDHLLVEDQKLVYSPAP